MHYQSPTETGNELSNSVQVHGAVISSLTDAAQPVTTAYVPSEAGTGQVDRPVRLSHQPGEMTHGGKAKRKLDKKKSNKTANDLIAKREHISRILRTCRGILEDIVDAEDPVEISNSAHTLMQEFKSLWQYRDARESEWADVVNLLQIALPRQEFEDVSKKGWETISRIFDECLVNRIIRNDDTRRAVRLLKEGGFDPWRGLSSSSLVAG